MRWHASILRRDGRRKEGGDHARSILCSPATAGARSAVVADRVPTRQPGRLDGLVPAGDGHTPATAQPAEVPERAQPVSESLPVVRASGDPGGSPGGAGAAPTAPGAWTPAGAEAHPRPHRSGEGGQVQGPQRSYQGLERQAGPAAGHAVSGHWALAHPLGISRVAR